MNLVINTSADATNSLVNSLSDNNIATLDPIFFGDVINVTATFTNGLGDYADFVGKTNNLIKIGLGNPITRDEYSSSIMSYANNQYNCILDISTQDLDDVLITDKVDIYLEIQISYKNGETSTLFQKLITMREQIIL
jgi:hypothetical protein